MWRLYAVKGMCMVRKSERLCPVDGLFRERIEAGQVVGERSLFVVISLHDRALEIADDFHAFVRVGIVADHVAEAGVMRDVVRARVGEDGLQGFQIGMNVSKNSKTHWDPGLGNSRIINPLVWRNTQFFLHLAQFRQEGRHAFRFAHVVQCDKFRVGLALVAGALG